MLYLFLLSVRNITYEVFNQQKLFKALKVFCRAGSSNPGALFEIFSCAHTLSQGTASIIVLLFSQNDIVSVE